MLKQLRDSYEELVQHTGPKDSLWERLKAACADDWDRYMRNRFVWQLADGSLPHEAYRHWVEQDYIYCTHYCRGYALAAYKAKSIPDMRKSVMTLLTVIDKELELHRAKLREWGITERQIQSLPEANANLAYTRYLLDVGMKGDVLDMLVALSICVIGYGELGRMLVAHENTRLEGNPYRDWIEQYASDMFRDAGVAALEQMDEQAEGLVTPARFDELVAIYRKTLNLDIDFWDMCIDRKL